MIGALIGDIVGSRFEFNPTNDYNFHLFCKESTFTDDTICTIAVADAIINGESFEKSIHRWCQKYPFPMGGYGGRFAEWVSSKNPKAYNSFGNGAAMRVSPIAWAYDTLDEVLEQAKKSAECTHNHPEGIKGAQTVAMAIYLLRKNIVGSKYENGNIVDYVLRECVRFSQYDLNIQREEVINVFDETCHGTVPVALWIIRESFSLEDAIRKAVSLGADADTLGAIVGSIAESIWGVPDDLYHQALSFLPEEMKQVVKDFYKIIGRDNL